MAFIRIICGPASIPDIPAGPAIEHRDFGILAIRGPGIKNDEGCTGLGARRRAHNSDALWTAGRRGHGRQGARQAFEEAPKIETIPSWEDVPGDDGRHPPHTRLDPVAAAASLEQLVALGYIDGPTQTARRPWPTRSRELRFNLAEAYQDDARHSEMLALLRKLHEADPDEQRYAVHRFISCQAPGRLDELREIVADLDGRRRDLYEESRRKVPEFHELMRGRLKEARRKPATARRK